MQHVSANDFMTGCAKAAIDTALAHAKGQQVGAVPASEPEGARPTPEAAQPARGASR